MFQDREKLEEIWPLGIVFIDPVDVHVFQDREKLQDIWPLAIGFITYSRLAIRVFNYDFLHKKGN